MFTLLPGVWSSNVIKGPRPPPCADFALISIDKWRAILYGGRRGSDHDSKDLYIIDFNALVRISSVNVVHACTKKVQHSTASYIISQHKL